MNLKMRKVTTIQIEGEGVLDCLTHRWSRPIISYDGEVFKVGCPYCRMCVDKNLYKAVYMWNSSVETQAEVMTREG